MSYALAIAVDDSLTRGNFDMEKPELAAVLEYARKNVDHYIREKAADLPSEMKEEISQNAMLRICEAYPDLDPMKGWKSFVQTHCRGSVLDYMRDGHGFQESKWSLAEKEIPEDEEESEEEHPEESSPLDDLASAGGAISIPPTRAVRNRNVPLRMRIEIQDEESGAVRDVEEIAAMFGVHSDSQLERRARIYPTWPLIARMAGVYEDVHLLAKVLMGFTHTELAESFGVSRERLTQRIKEFFDDLDNAPDGDQIADQKLYAFGLWELYGVEKKDNGRFWELPEIDLTPKNTAATLFGRAQLTLFLN